MAVTTERTVSLISEARICVWAVDAGVLGCTAISFFLGKVCLQDLNHSSLPNKDSNHGEIVRDRDCHLDATQFLASVEGVAVRGERTASHGQEPYEVRTDIG